MRAILASHRGTLVELLVGGNLLEVDFFIEEDRGVRNVSLSFVLLCDVLRLGRCGIEG